MVSADDLVLRICLRGLDHYLMEKLLGIAVTSGVAGSKQRLTMVY